MRLRDSIVRRVAQVSPAAMTFLMLAPGVPAQTPPKPPAPPDPPAFAYVYGSGARSFLGVGVTEVDSARAKELKLKEERGVEITRVEPDSPAEKAGLLKGDVVTEYQGQRIEGTEQFVRLVRETPVGRQVRMLVSRGGAAQTITATIGMNKGLAKLAERFKIAPRIEIPEIYIPDIPRVFQGYRSTILGIEAETLEPQLATYFGVKEGVLVRSVTKGSAAEKAGIKAGDVIVKVDKTDVTSPREVSSAVRKARASQKSFPVTAMRERKEVTLSVTLEDEERNERVARPGRMAIRFEDFEF